MKTGPSADMLFYDMTVLCKVLSRTEKHSFFFLSINKP